MQLPDDLQEKRGCWKLEEEALDRCLWRTSLGRGYGLIALCGEQVWEEAMD